jgi:hypothetical protein
MSPSAAGEGEESMTRRFVAVTASLALWSSAYSFETDGFKSGMAFSEAQRLIKSRFTHIEIKDDYIGASNAPGTHRDIFLTFCKGRLVMLQRYFDPRFETFVRLVADKSKELGTPLDTMARPANVDGVKVNAISFLWRVQSDFLLVSYTEFPTNAQLDVVYQARNDCWSTPLFPREVTK